uniref:Uncharacterized protein n=1 Tax=Avena sativa TaxID=4498 RepID=A0ACD5TR40_AVESA
MAQNNPLSVRVPTEGEWEGNSMAGEPMSPTGRMMEEMNAYMVLVMGLGEPISLPAFLAGIETELLPRFPRLRSIQAMDASKYGMPRWVETKVNVDDHIIVPRLDPAILASDPEKAIEDYVASLSMLPMDRSRPLWDFHFLNFPTSEAASTVVMRLHHSIGDGTSLMTLLMASSRSTTDPSRLPAMPPPPRRKGAIYEQSRPPLSDGSLAFLAWIWSYFVLAWHTLVDFMLLVATLLFLKDPYTLLKRANGGGDPYRRRLVHRSISLDDIKFIKTTMNCTVNDVLVGVTSAALSRYYFRKSGDTNTKRSISLRSIIPVNTRPISNRQIVTFIYRRFATHTSLLLSNIIGPAEKITLCGHPVVFIAITAYGNPQALTVHYVNYDSTVKIILAVDDEHFPDCHLLLDEFTESIRLINNTARLKSITTLRMPSS